MPNIIPLLDFHNERTPASSFARQAWLEVAVEALPAKFSEAGYAVPENVRVSIGWPKHAGTCGVVGECWPVEASSDRHAELFISPALMAGADILHILAHELVHATVGVEAEHGKLFKQCANKIGLAGPMRSTVAGPELIAWADTLFERIGPYPAGFLVNAIKQSTRQLKCECPACGYLARVTRKWLDAAGPPICPNDLAPLIMTTGDAS